MDEGARGAHGHCMQFMCEDYYWGLRPLVLMSQIVSVLIYLLKKFLFCFPNCHDKSFTIRKSGFFLPLANQG